MPTWALHLLFVALTVGLNLCACAQNDPTSQAQQPEAVYPPLRTDCAVADAFTLQGEVIVLGKDPAVFVGCVVAVPTAVVLGTTSDGWLQVTGAGDQPLMVMADRAYVDGTLLRDRSLQFLGPQQFSTVVGGTMTALAFRFVQ